MVYRRISADMKYRALELLLEGWEVASVAEVLGVSEWSLARWKDDLEKTGAIAQQSIHQGRVRILNTSVIEDLQDLINEMPSLYLDEIAEWLALNHDIPISISALHKTLVDMGLTYKVLKRHAAQRDEEARAAWREIVRHHFTREQFVFLDESSKDGRTFHRKYGRAPAGKRAIEEAPFERGDRWSILPALSLQGYIAIHVVPGSVDGGVFFDFVVDDVLPQMQPYPRPQSILVMDNCSTHKSEALQVAVEAAGCRLFFIPPYSPDLNPIEESFNSVKKYLQRHWQRFEDAEFPELELLEACMAAVTPEKAEAWFKDCGYV